MIRYLIQRIDDYLREMRIQELGAHAVRAFDSGDLSLARGYWGMMVEEIDARSPEQIARMEARMKKPRRSAFKRFLVSAYCRGLLPGVLVAGLFRLFDLRGQ